MLKILPPQFCIRNAQVLLPDRLLPNASVIISRGKISRIAHKDISLEGSFAIDAKGCYISPGFIDTHIHGEARKVFNHEVKFGTTAIVLAISCGSVKVLKTKIRNIRGFISNNKFGRSVLGLRLEGPFINTVKAGAQDRRFIRKASLRELKEIIKICGSSLKMMTVAPEIDGGLDLISILRKNNIIASIGHSDATSQEARRGIAAGARHATHLYNAMRKGDALDAGASGACIGDERFAVEIIPDMVHVPKEWIRSAIVGKKDKSKIIVITDSVRAERSNPPRGGVYRLKDGTIAGSSLTMIKALENLVTKCGVSLPDAVSFMTINPAMMFGCDKYKGTIECGKDADLVVFDKNFDVKMTFVRGKIAYHKPCFALKAVK